MPRLVTDDHHLLSLDNSKQRFRHQANGKNLFPILTARPRFSDVSGASTEKQTIFELFPGRPKFPSTSYERELA
jgi:hypothetical protein